MARTLPTKQKKPKPKSKAKSKIGVTPLSFEEEMMDVFNVHTAPLDSYLDTTQQVAEIASKLESVLQINKSLENRIAELERSLQEIPIVELAPAQADILGDAEDMTAFEEWASKYESDYLNVKKIKDTNMPVSGRHIESDGTIKWYENGKVSREGGPAEIRPNGTSLYYKNGLLHREGGMPAMVCNNGTTKYALNGKYHRAGGLPAITWGKSNYRNEYWIHGEIIRAEKKDGTKEWYAPGSTNRDTAKLHRIDGPAVIYKSGVEEYWLYGENFATKSDWLAALNNLTPPKTLSNITMDESLSETTEAPVYTKSSTTKGSSKMSNEKPSLGEMFKANATDAAYRVAGTQATKAVTTALVQVMRNKGADNGQIQGVAAFLDTEFGAALISTMLGFGLEYVPHFSKDERVKRLAEEMRIGGMAVAGNAIIGEAVAHLLPALTEALKALPPAEENNNVRVETKHHESKLADHLAEEEEMIEIEKDNKQTMKL